MAPERFSGRWLLSPTADVYSIGIMLVQLYAGTLPFRFDKATPFEELASNQVQENAQTLLTGATPAFREFCLRCIDLDAAQRPSNFGEMSKALDRLSR
jgi:serine/threonine protein kinase